LGHSPKARLLVDDDRPLLVAVGDEVEEQLAAGAIEGDESDLVEEEELGRAQDGAAGG